MLHSIHNACLPVQVFSTASALPPKNVMSSVHRPNYICVIIRLHKLVELHGLTQSAQTAWTRVEQLRLTQVA